MHFAPRTGLHPARLCQIPHPSAPLRARGSLGIPPGARGGILPHGPDPLLAPGPLVSLVAQPARDPL